MKERPILFSAPMVRALIDGTKTQTRRVVKPQPMSSTPGMTFSEPYTKLHGRQIWLRGWGNSDQVVCPYGQPGERLWVRENGWERPERTPKMMREGADTWKPYYFNADGLNEQDSDDFKAWGFKRRPSIHMPRWASRITLEITGVRVDRLQDISEADAIAEGIERSYDQWRDYRTDAAVNYPSAATPIDSYRTLQEQINGPDSWDANPWVWVVEFKRLDQQAISGGNTK